MGLAFATAATSVGVAFIFAGTSKLLDPSSAIVAVQSYVGDMWASAARVRVLACIELVLAASLLFTQSLGIGAPLFLAAAAAALFSLGFFVVLIRAYLAGDRTPCGCFGHAGDDEQLSIKVVARPALFVILLVPTVVRPDAASNLSSRTTGILVTVVAALGSTIALVFVSQVVHRLRWSNGEATPLIALRASVSQ